MSEQQNTPRPNNIFDIIEQALGSGGNKFFYLVSDTEGAWTTITEFGRTWLGLEDGSDLTGSLNLGTAAYKDVGVGSEDVAAGDVLALAEAYTDTEILTRQPFSTDLTTIDNLTGSGYLFKDDTSGNYILQSVVISGLPDIVVANPNTPYIVFWNTKGVITGYRAITFSDIPQLPMSKITGLGSMASESTTNFVTTSLIGAVNGVCELGGDRRIPAIRLPSYIDVTVEYANLAAFPTTGVSNTIYLARDTNSQYRWSGSMYAELIQSPGTTDHVIEGVNNLYYTATRVNSIVTPAISGLKGSPPTSLDTLEKLANAIPVIGTTSGTVAAGNDPRISKFPIGIGNYNPPRNNVTITLINVLFDFNIPTDLGSYQYNVDTYPASGTEIYTLYKYNNGSWSSIGTITLSTTTLTVSVTSTNFAIGDKVKCVSPASATNAAIFKVDFLATII